MKLYSHKQYHFHLFPTEFTMSKSRTAADRRSSIAVSQDNVIEILDLSDSNDSSSMSRETRSKAVKAMKKINKLREEGGMTDFNPDKSVRERKKISKVVQATQGRKKNSAMFSPTGIFLKTGQDLCDCLEEECPGCFYQCVKCNGPKCGLTCRRRRNWYYEHITVDGQSKSSVSTSLAELLGDL